MRKRRGASKGMKNFYFDTSKNSQDKIIVERSFMVPYVEFTSILFFPPHTVICSSQVGKLRVFDYDTIQSCQILLEQEEYTNGHTFPLEKFSDDVFLFGGIGIVYVYKVRKDGLQVIKIKEFNIRDLTSGNKLRDEYCNNFQDVLSLSVRYISERECYCLLKINDDLFAMCTSSGIYVVSYSESMVMYSVSHEGNACATSQLKNSFMFPNSVFFSAERRIMLLNYKKSESLFQINPRGELCNGEDDETFEEVVRRQSTMKRWSRNIESSTKRISAKVKRRSKRKSARESEPMSPKSPLSPDSPMSDKSIQREAFFALEVFQNYAKEEIVVTGGEERMLHFWRSRRKKKKRKRKRKRDPESEGEEEEEEEEEEFYEFKEEYEMEDHFYLRIKTISTVLSILWVESGEILVGQENGCLEVIRGERNAKVKKVCGFQSDLCQIIELFSYSSRDMKTVMVCGRGGGEVKVVKIRTRRSFKEDLWEDYETRMLYIQLAEGRFFKYKKEDEDENEGELVEEDDGEVGKGEKSVFVRIKLRYLGDWRVITNILRVLLL